jgi:hypothetical protein
VSYFGWTVKLGEFLAFAALFFGGLVSLFFGGYLFTLIGLALIGSVI